MTLLRVAIGVMWVLTFVAGRQWTESATALPNAATSADFTLPHAVPSGEVGEGSLVEPDDPYEAADPRYDLFGNEIEEAVADYRIDIRGGVYERHSPDTAVPKLASPVT